MRRTLTRRTITHTASHPTVQSPRRPLPPKEATMTDQHPTDGRKPDGEHPDGRGRHAERHADKHDADRHHAEKHHEPKPADEETAAVVSLDTAGGAMEPSAVPATAQSGKIPVGPETLVRRIFTGSGMVSVLAVLLALILGGLLIALTDRQVGTTSTYLLARPTDFLSAVWNAATRSYVALFQGSVFNPRGAGIGGQLAPLMETLTIATPLITAGLGVALAFRAGLFNIGAQGQIIMAGILAAWAGFALHLPVGLHLVLVL